MKIEEFNPGHSFRVGGTTCGRLCRYLAQLAGVSFIRRPHFFWSCMDVGAEFTFHEQKFKIDTDPWDYALWIITGDDQSHLPEMLILRLHIEQQHNQGIRI
jgi:hypothetical protein